MIYGYLRVSSDEQDVNSQKQGVESFAKDRSWTIDKFITDEGVSGGKDPDKRNLGPLLKIIQKGDIIIASEISRLGRDLYMVMDILHFCMEKGCIIYTVKDQFILGHDIQSKVLAFAFGLSAEIERQMIRQRTKEGLKLRVKMGILLGRPPESNMQKPLDETFNANKDKIIEQYKWGVPERRIAKNFNIDRNTLTRWLHRWGVKYSKYVEKLNNTPRVTSYKDGDYEVIDGIDSNKMTKLIELDLTIPQIAEQFPEYTYEQIYDTIYCSRNWNNLYRKHGQLKIKKKRI